MSQRLFIRFLAELSHKSPIQKYHLLKRCSNVGFNKNFKYIQIQIQFISDSVFSQAGQSRKCRVGSSLCLYYYLPSDPLPFIISHLTKLLDLVIFKIYTLWSFHPRIFRVSNFQHPTTIIVWCKLSHFNISCISIKIWLAGRFFSNQAHINPNR